MHTVSFLDMFAKSPVSPLQNHMKKALEASELVYEFFVALLANDQAGVERYHHAVCDAEHEADKLKQELRLQLSEGLFMSMSRTDILSLLKAQEVIANLSLKIVSVVYGRQMVIPESFSKELLRYVRRSVDAVHQAHKAVSKVSELMEIGFKGREVEKIQTLTARLDDIQEEVDDMHIALRKQLYQIESSLAPIDAIFLYQLLLYVGKLATKAEEVGERVMLLPAK